MDGPSKKQKLAPFKQLVPWYLLFSTEPPTDPTGLVEPFKKSMQATLVVDGNLLRFRSIHEVNHGVEKDMADNPVFYVYEQTETPNMFLDHADPTKPPVYIFKLEPRRDFETTESEAWICFRHNFQQKWMKENDVMCYGDLTSEQSDEMQRALVVDLVKFRKDTMLKYFLSLSL